MPHELRFSTDPSLATHSDIPEEDAVSPAAHAIFEAYLADGRITESVRTNEDAIAGTYDSVITFVDGTTCDAYLLEMEGINEFDKSGASRTNLSRGDVD